MNGVGQVPFTHDQLRAQVAGELRRDLLGPKEVDEVLTERPEDHYLVGLLSPAGSMIENEDTEDELSAESGDNAAADETRSSTGGLRQSSIGLTFAVTPTTSGEIEVSVTYAVYPRLENASGAVKGNRWRRVALSNSMVFQVSREEAITRLSDGGELLWKARPSRDLIFITISLVNRNDWETISTRKTFFQPQLRIVPLNGTRIISPPQEKLRLSDDDEETDALLYRDVKEFAVGHGCAVDWTERDGSADELVTNFMPDHGVPNVEPRTESKAMMVMRVLAECESDAVLASELRPLAEEYGAWIDGRASLIPRLGDEALKTTARRHLGDCRGTLDRMVAGINLIETAPDVAEAFRFANAAMDDQRRQSILGRRRRERKELGGPIDPPAWRPFQLAFILLNLASLANPWHIDREVADLLWFPTGGGKTEAYLGLAAFAIGHRRLMASGQGQGGQGTTVLMRYTLRLLTAQQFERAATLICACEKIRRQSPQTWGDEPIRIGLWVGDKTSPNNIDDAREKLKKLARREIELNNHPFVLRFCPWCGEALPIRSFRLDEIRQRLSIHCEDQRCDFSQTPLPAMVVDDEIYRSPPSMLIGTVDKFARLPWVPDAARLFGYTGKARAYGLEILAPPSLIIQDELHLISGPLGSLVGIYESVVDYLCGREIEGNRYGPKIVASTATIRRSGEQVVGLFARGVRLFPPPLLDPSDSYFAHVVPIDKKPGRLFLGVCAFGKSAKTTLVRVYSRLLISAGEFAATPSLVDPYWTIIGYFNSLAQLGGAVSLVQDDVTMRLKSLASRSSQGGRLVMRQSELTSRIPSTEIPERLAEMQQSVATGKSIDILLASNMISVGLDVGRLGLMVISAQPKQTAEYIQASSRVGREFPGLVVTVYNWIAPRDLSHYERFGVYHRSLYRHVEATSVTPFAARCRDKGLHAITIAALRLTHPKLGPNDAARKFDLADGLHEEFLRYLVSRVRIAAPDEWENVELELLGFLSEWETRASGSSSLKYEDRKSPDRGLMIVAGSPNRSSLARETLNSLRDVEQEARWQKEV